MFSMWTAVSSLISEDNRNKMKIANINLYSLILAASFVLSGCSVSHTITVSNRLGFQRGETVTVPAKYVKDPKNTVLLDGDNRQVAWQLTENGDLLFTANVKANSSSTYTLTKGYPASFDSLCVGYFRADRMDDFIWENDKSGYRTYGPALQKNGERAFGYDVFTKSVSRNVMKERFDNAIYKKISFHEDHGNGMDSYAVGPTLGCGTDALVHGDSLVYPWAWESYRIIEQGPVRFSAEFVYSPVKAGDDIIAEKRIISLDRNSHLNKVSISFDKVSEGTGMVAGTVVHKENPAAYFHKEDEDAAYLGYADLGDRNIGKNGEIYVGCVFPFKVEKVGYSPFSEQEMNTRGGAIGQVMAWFPYTSGLTYWFGSAWSKADIKTLEEWEEYLRQFKETINNPLTITIK